MSHTKEQLKNDLYNLEVRPGDVLLIHSSYKSLGGIEGGAKAFFEGVIEFLGSNGTLIVPALSYNVVTRDNPVFNINETPSCIGYLPEFFRTSVPGVVRSMHATHSCCATGKYAVEITKDHYKDITPVGLNSPFRKLPEFDGKILMIGCGLARNTSMHGIEEDEDVNAPYCIDRDNPLVYTLTDGKTTVEQTAYRHNFSDGNGGVYAQHYERIAEFLNEDEIKCGLLLSAESYLMDAKAVWKKGKEKMKKEPCYFVELVHDNQ